MNEKETTRLFRTGVDVPAGNYEYVGHVDPAEGCTVTQANPARVSSDEANTFPPCPRCGREVFWKERA